MNTRDAERRCLQAQSFVYTADYHIGRSAKLVEIDGEEAVAEVTQPFRLCLLVIQLPQRQQSPNKRHFEYYFRCQPRFTEAISEERIWTGVHYLLVPLIPEPTLRIPEPALGQNIA